ncbi:unnamed protein product [Trichobilharzia regenti]|nr:unnamed protein product [Trichobilharzia regenti]
MSGDTEATFILSLDDDDSTIEAQTNATKTTDETTVEFSISITDDAVEAKGETMSLEEQLAWCKLVLYLLIGELMLKCMYGYMYLNVYQSKYCVYISFRVFIITVQHRVSTAHFRFIQLSDVLFS